jgi:hypothetical protein
MIAKDLIGAVTEAPRTVALGVIMAFIGYMWAGNVFASKEDIKGLEEKLECRILNISASVAALSANIQKTSLQQERRTLSREIDVKARLEINGEASDDDLEVLSNLRSDLRNVEDALAALPNTTQVTSFCLN